MSTGKVREWLTLFISNKHIVSSVVTIKYTEEAMLLFRNFLTNTFSVRKVRFFWDILKPSVHPHCLA